jgi:hypothetical protein
MSRGLILMFLQEGMSQQSVTRVRRFQRELEAAEDRADTAESNLSLIRAKHRTFVTTSTVPGSQVYLVQETHRTATTDMISTTKKGNNRYWGGGGDSQYARFWSPEQMNRSSTRTSLIYFKWRV